MKKVLTSAGIILSFALYVFFHSSSDGIVTTPVIPPIQSASTTDQQATDSVTPVTTGYKDGSYTGSVADAYYGNIQVKAIIQNGKLTDVQFLQYPNDHHESIEINTRAMPLLKQEAITAQSAAVDTVTRATDSSIAFRQSLAAALAQAK